MLTKCRRKVSDFCRIEANYRNIPENSTKPGKIMQHVTNIENNYYSVILFCRFLKMLQNAYLLARIGADTARNGQSFTKHSLHLDSDLAKLVNP